jgi:D-amino-acid dehydrogenase
MKVAVVGGGIVGLACAWELVRDGAEVDVYEAGTLGGGVSRGNAGWICPSISSPLPAPGMVREGLSQLLHRKGAFVIRPRADPTFVRWLWSFGSHCNVARYEEGTKALLELNRTTMELYDRYRDEGVRFEQHKTGLLIAALSEAGLASYSRLTQLLRRLGYEGQVQELDGAAAARLEPALDGDRVAVALHARLDRHVRPESLTAGLAGSLRRMGATIHEHHRIESLDELAADKIVVAAGLGSVRLLRPRVPLIGAGGYSITIAGRGTPPVHALYLAEAKLGISPFDDGVRIAGVLELGARTARPRADTGARLVAAAAPYLRGWLPATAGQAVPWAGLRPATADGLPLIGAVPGKKNVFAATGHAMLGVTLAPSTAAALAPLVLRGEQSAVLAPFGPNRPARPRRRRPRGSLA